MFLFFVFTMWPSPRKAIEVTSESHSAVLLELIWLLKIIIIIIIIILVNKLKNFNCLLFDLEWRCCDEQETSVATTDEQIAILQALNRTHAQVDLVLLGTDRSELSIAAADLHNVAARRATVERVVGLGDLQIISNFNF